MNHGGGADVGIEVSPVIEALALYPDRLHAESFSDGPNPLGSGGATRAKEEQEQQAEAGSPEGGPHPVGSASAPGAGEGSGVGDRKGKERAKDHVPI
jgi:hypothetical protein